MKNRIKLTSLIGLLSILCVSCVNVAPTITTVSTHPPMVIVGQAVWPQSHFQSELIRQLIQKLGHFAPAPASPAEHQSMESLATYFVQTGYWHIWANSWMPTFAADNQQHDQIVRKNTPLITNGGMQGFVLTRSFAEEHNIQTVDDLNHNPEAFAEFDKYDPNPGDGTLDMYGCQANWECAHIIDDYITATGWNIRQKHDINFNEMITQAAALADEGKPMLAYLWTPSVYMTELTPGRNVTWIGVDKLIPDATTHQMNDYAPISDLHDLCYQATTYDVCRYGFTTYDINVIANREFYDMNPDIAELLKLIELDALDVSYQIEKYLQGADISDVVKEWIIANQTKVDSWIKESQNAASWVRYQSGTESYHST